MPAQKAKAGSIFGAAMKDQLRQAHKEHKDDPVNMGNMELPPGIRQGVAQLVECKFDKYKSGANEGKPYFYAAATVKSPTHHGGKKIEGLRTSIMEPLCDTPSKSRQTVFDHYGWILNELKKIGGEDCVAGIDEDNPEPGLLEVAAELKAAKPHIRFETSSGKPTKEYPNPMTFHNWFGSCDEPEAGEESADVVDETGDEHASQNGQAVSGGDAGDVDLNALAELADGGDEDAMNALKAAAAEAGMDPEADDGPVATAENWAAVVTLIEEAQADGGEEPQQEEEEQPTIPAKGDTWKYQPIDPKTKKPMINKAKKPVLIECEVMAVDKKASTVLLKNSDDNKTLYKNVPFDKLVSPE